MKNPSLMFAVSMLLSLPVLSQEPQEFYDIDAHRNIVSDSADLPAQSEKWRLVWSDEFNTDGLIDTTKWSKIPRGTPDWKNYMSDDDRLFDVREGNLVLKGMKNDRPDQDTAAYLTGGVYSMQKYALKYGKVEVRAKLDNARGCWPAVWMLPDVENRKWPDDGEIDIMEHLNFDTIAYQTVHSHYTHTLGKKMEPKSSFTGTIDRLGYNVYGVEKTPDKIIFYINGKVTGEYPRIETELPGQYPFDTPYYILLDMQLGGSWVGAVEPSQLPVEMFIDWVRVYEK